MPTVVKKAINNEGHHDRAVVRETTTSYANDPFFVKKANEAKEVIKKVGVPVLKKK